MVVTVIRKCFALPRWWSGDRGGGRCTMRHIVVAACKWLFLSRWYLRSLDSVEWLLKVDNPVVSVSAVMSAITRLMGSSIFRTSKLEVNMKLFKQVRNLHCTYLKLSFH